jgi:hypothetical protein
MSTRPRLRASRFLLYPTRNKHGRSMERALSCFMQPATLDVRAPCRRSKQQSLGCRNKIEFTSQTRSWGVYHSHREQCGPKKSSRRLFAATKNSRAAWSNRRPRRPFRPVCGAAVHEARVSSCGPARFHPGPRLLSNRKWAASSRPV